MANVKAEEGDDSLEAAARSRAERGSPGSTPGREIPPKNPPMPPWFCFATPVIFVTVVALLAIGGWAIGAILYMQRVTPMAPEDVQYPLLRWSDDVGTSGGYSPESRLMALAMLGCIPLALIMAILYVVLRRQNRRQIAPAIKVKAVE